ncbi:MAG: hypothetical protein HN368_03080 [Spirochaetales bacterium]|jgi:hypothetical protein|nr:hypothetical protein [Spirochaetales bacterium]
MKYADFMSSLSSDAPPADISRESTALWLEKNGDWDEAHTIVQDIPQALGSAVHAYLHRKEGDLGNAGYWYRRAGRAEFSGSLDEEWDSLVKEIFG